MDAEVEILKPSQVAKLLQVSAHTVSRLPIPRVQFNGRVIRYLRADVLAYLAGVRAAAPALRRGM